MAAYDTLGCQGSSWDSELAIQCKLAWSQVNLQLGMATIIPIASNSPARGMGEPAIRYGHYSFKTLLVKDCRGPGSNYFASLNTSVDMLRMSKAYISEK